MYKNVLILGPNNSGKTTFINTYLNIIKYPQVTIGLNYYKDKINKINIWECGNGLYYDFIIKDILSHINIIILIFNNIDYIFIKKIYELCNIYNIKNVIIILNNKNIKNNKNIRYNNINNININNYYYNINCINKLEVQNIFDFIKNNI